MDRHTLESSRRESEPVLIQTIGLADVLGSSWLFRPYYWHFDARAVEATEAVFFTAHGCAKNANTTPISVTN